MSYLNIGLAKISAWNPLLNRREFLTQLALLFGGAITAIIPASGLVRLVSAQGNVNQTVQVSFDAVPSLTIMYPRAYQFNVVAETSSGLTITNLHWDFGDGSTLDVPFSAQNVVGEIQYHIYSQAGTYNVAVTATDNSGNVGTVQATVQWP